VLRSGDAQSRNLEQCMRPITGVMSPPRLSLATHAREFLSAAGRHYHIILLAAILGLGLGLRLYRLGDVPAGFFCDEASIGYNAYTLLTQRADEYGVPHPMFFRAFGEYKSPVEIYSTVPFIAVFGLHEVAVRLPSVVYGELCLVAIYLLVRQLFGHSRHREALALLSALFLAISPWHIHFSRVALEGLMPWVFFTTFGLYLFLKAQERAWLLPAALVSFALALYSYFPARIFVPLLGIGLCAIYYRFFLSHWRETLVSAAVLAACLVPFIQNLFSPGGFARWQQVSIFAIDHPPDAQPIWQHIVLNYLSHFSLDFLFTKGDIDMPGQAVTRHSVHGMGELYLFQLPLVVLGLVFLASLWRRWHGISWRQTAQTPIVLALWLILYPVGSMFTTDAAAQATRSIIGVVPWQVVSAAGLVYLFQVGSQLVQRYRADPMLSPVSMAAGVAGAVTTVAAILVFFVSYLSLYFGSYNSYASDFWGWQFGARDIVHYFVQHQDSYDGLVMAPEFNAPDIFFSFYAPGECAKCKVGLPDDTYQAGRRQLFAITPGYTSKYSSSFKTVQTVRYPNGGVAFLLVEIPAASS